MPSPSAGSDEEQHARQSRRAFLLGVGATAALAGCLADSDDGATPDEDDDTTTPDPDDGTATPGSADGTETPGADDGSDGGDGARSLSRAEARELVPPDALALRYEPPLDEPYGEFWAAVVGDTDATAIRAEAASGTYNEVTPQEGTVDGYLGVPVQVDPEGDEVTVFAVDEDGARGPVTSSRVPTDDLSTDAARQAVPPDALSFTYAPPDAGEFGELTIDVTTETGADTLVAQPREAPDVFADRVGDLGDERTLDSETTLDVAVDPAGDEVVLSATVDGATGEVTRWQGPD